MFDLHTHSVCSDGTTSPATNAGLAAQAGLDGFALTDHDTFDGWAEAAAACGRLGLSFVPGVELSTEYRGFSVHLLGYWVDPTHPELAAECARLRDERLNRARRIVERLGELGIELRLEDVLARAGDAPVGRPHVAAAMVAAGAVPDLEAAFDGYLADGGPAWVPKHALDPADGVALLRAAGGVAVLAHPGSDERGGVVDLDLVDRLTEAGLAGLEADHPGHDAEQVTRWRAAAAARHLLVTGASDFHGGQKDARIGERTTPAPVVHALQQRIAPPAQTRRT